MNLRKQTTYRDGDPTVAQRIKRLPSIRHKLERMPSMKLSRMQDIGGCRAVVSTVPVLNGLVEYYAEASRIKHKLIRNDQYVLEPKPSGYRGVHLVYRYYSDRKPTWNGLNIEIQLRSRLQHAWATAVETVGLFTQQALKSSWGDEAWLRFFALMSSIIAQWEGTPPVPGTPSDPAELVRELRDYVTRLDVITRLNAYGAVVSSISGAAKGHTFLLELDIQRQSVSARVYEDRAVAAEEYSAVERAVENQPGKDVVLVTVESVESLRRAYPNYFLDTRAFVESVERAIRPPSTRRAPRPSRRLSQPRAS